MSLDRTAAEVMALAQADDADAGLRLAHRTLAAAGDAAAADRAALWYAVAVAEHIRGDLDGQVAAANHCLEAAREADEPGWVSNALSIRAMAQVRRGAVEPALVDLARSEVALAGCDDDGLVNWAHTGLGYCYLELRLYELALPHFEGARDLVGCPLPLRESRTIDLMNLAELHLRWADELERARPYDGSGQDVEAHRAEGHQYAKEALAEVEGLGPVAMLSAARAAELCSRPRDEAGAAVPELRAAYDGPGHLAHSGTRPTLGAALARALWRLDRRQEALSIAREAARLSAAATDWQVGASVHWLLVEMEAEAGTPGATAGRDYGRLLSRALWNQRLSTLQGATAALEVERLHHDRDVARRAAAEDPLTGVGNRRALDDALRAATARERAGDAGGVDAVLPTSLLLVDLDEFKAVNDTYGHVAGDEALRAVADAIRGVARAGDVVARLGGDEFVVLARDADAAAGRLLAERVTAAVDALALAVPGGSLRLRASVGVASTGPDVAVGDLLAAADASMYGAKGRPR